MGRGGFSLLEVILALAILAGAIAVLGEVSRIGLDNARIARDLSRAKILCEGKLAEILSGCEPPESQDSAPFDVTVDSSDADWVYSVEVTPMDDQGLLEVRVTVSKDLSAEKWPVEFSLVEWMVDPAIETVEKAGAAMAETGGAP
jgi:type II secretion system protein I